MNCGTWQQSDEFALCGFLVIMCDAGGIMQRHDDFQGWGAIIKRGQRARSLRSIFALVVYINNTYRQIPRAQRKFDHPRDSGFRGVCKLGQLTYVVGFLPLPLFLGLDPPFPFLLSKQGWTLNIQGTNIASLFARSLLYLEQQANFEMSVVARFHPIIINLTGLLLDPVQCWLGLTFAAYCR